MSSEIKVYEVELTELQPDPSNANAGSERGQYMLETSIEETGLHRGVAVDANGYLVAGNKTHQAAIDAGFTKAIIVETDGDTLVVTKRRDFDLQDSDPNNKARKAAYFDNRASDFMEWNAEQLLADMQSGLDLSDMFRQDELDELLAGLQPEPEPVSDPGAQVDKAETEKLAEQYGIKLGQKWQLGRHCLYVGDSTDAGMVAQLLNGSKALVYTDPPYGVSVVQGNKIGASNLAQTGTYAPIVGDETTDTARKFYETCVEVGLKEFIIWGGNYFTGFLPPSPCWLVWDKRGDMASNNFADCEIAWTSFSGPARIYKQIWSGMIKEGESGKRVHPTQKPVALAEWAMGLSSAGVVFDGFLGSGSTLIACENLDKQCIAAEISAAYAAVAINRWEAASGLKAERLSG